MTGLKRGDWVRLEYKEQVITAMVWLASGNSRSLMLGFDGVIDGHVGMMPVLMGNDGRYYSIMTGVEARVTAT
ncbi:hypothetical protein U0F71_06665 [Burkholderia pseudomallei]|uniref:hypothetical protein n=1 Tax=Burkholderia pseudomallei TaxID=28450 RepID=UPI002AB57B59|nr:hypothetical protein [Burkholderia pseudomallei]MDY7815396.1 hypothetical protein [Burkholderia pseudomallei]MDY7862043.1 hypothetical protein [Burkholderia pseudomallei]